MNQPQESEVTLIAETITIDGALRMGSRTEVPSVVRIHGKVLGEITEAAPTTLQLMETSSVEGAIQASEIFAAGYVKGSITATKKIVVQNTARIEGDLFAPVIEVKPGSYVEGKIISKA